MGGKHKANKLGGKSGKQGKAKEKHCGWKRAFSLGEDRLPQKLPLHGLLEGRVVSKGHLTPNSLAAAPPLNLVLQQATVGGNKRT